MAECVAIKTVSVRMVALAAACGAARGETYFIGELSNSKTVEQELATALVIHTKMSSSSFFSSFFFLSFFLFFSFFSFFSFFL